MTFPLGIKLKVIADGDSLCFTQYPKRFYHVCMCSNDVPELQYAQVDYNAVVTAINLKLNELQLGGIYNKTWFKKSLQIQAYTAYDKLAIKYNLDMEEHHCYEQSGDNGVHLINTDEGLAILYRWEEYVTEVTEHKVYVK